MVHLPENWKVTPKQETVADGAFILTCDFSHPDPRTVRLNYIRESRAFQVDQARLPEFATHAEAARDHLGYQLSIN